MSASLPATGLAGPRVSHIIYDRAPALIPSHGRKDSPSHLPGAVPRGSSDFPKVLVRANSLAPLSHSLGTSQPSTPMNANLHRGSSPSGAPPTGLHIKVNSVFMSLDQNSVVPIGQALGMATTPLTSTGPLTMKSYKKLPQIPFFGERESPEPRDKELQIAGERTSDGSAERSSTPRPPGSPSLKLPTAWPKPQLGPTSSPPRTKSPNLGVPAHQSTERPGTPSQVVPSTTNHHVITILKKSTNSDDTISGEGVEKKCCECCPPAPFRRCAGALDDVIIEMEESAKECGCCCDCLCVAAMSVWTILGFVPKTLGCGIALVNGVTCGCFALMGSCPNACTQKVRSYSLSVVPHSDVCCEPVTKCCWGTGWIAASNLKLAGIAATSMLGKTIFGISNAVYKIGSCVGKLACFAKCRKKPTKEDFAEMRVDRVKGKKSVRCEKRYYRFWTDVLTGRLCISKKAAPKIKHGHLDDKIDKELHERMKDWVMHTCCMDCLKALVGSDSYGKTLSVASQQTAILSPTVYRAAKAPGRVTRVPSMPLQQSAISGDRKTPLEKKESRLEGKREECVPQAASSRAPKPMRTHDDPLVG